MRSSRRTLAVAASGVALALGALGIIGSSSAQAATQTTLSFDDLGSSLSGTHMLDGHGGLGKSSRCGWFFLAMPTALRLLACS